MGVSLTACCMLQRQGLGDIKPWAAGYDSVQSGGGGVGGAQDECILHYVRTPGQGNRAVCLDKNNNGGLLFLCFPKAMCRVFA